MPCIANSVEHSQKVTFNIFIPHDHNRFSDILLFAVTEATSSLASVTGSVGVWVTDTNLDSRSSLLFQATVGERFQKL